ncbi:DNA-binding protein [Haloferax mediterranei ATCC 33500]|uniref:Bacterio-opsin activator-like protein n=1 Tax=Haloferax mediterranei (strain ATCC 33500 / DSM 1411 / JCM 8866 / NBRC 14739 / NCIMB 2177 / R-4) TaxID=523841 RepID=I3R3N2_HALMT|nr:helix-turn-helix domain-containing protein [Haloferax mediterranei]AFK18842.2 bacterio-opsin activator-like protein [Haloferax mediterranei ATCC 33500]AHZ21793.1 DNA-binding protein [Haloferax mediterranei ATCC 33500]EMA03300.1 bacterio-opsin activator-like protein [Haloferax mediterranei ATCC 33500]MDX5988935.1 helix-turn-helix domain-containing protein [Haloferax mediterranei ATCC 33500]QCQ75330.1 DNA-binding protein [Haloferax mediterranei ATCC 33500]
MTSAAGIRAELKVTGPTDCPVASVSEGDTSGYALSRSMSPNEDGAVTEEFVFDDTDSIPDEMDQLFDYGDGSVYRFEREGGVGCPCEQVETFDCPVVDVQTRDGALFLTFHAPDVDTLRDVVSALREASGSVDVRRLLQSSSDESRDLVLVERGQLTDRQREVLEKAHDMGYFDHPRRANKGEVATELGITTSTFSEHLAMAQKKLMGAILQD